ncbi:hypothetical protein [Arthrobacter sp. SD76]|uniref:hypothetical protein n=1 Tax=Arthrobacter sp. SD76 TaxID=3415007 RepID=UPI003C760A03
MNFLPIADKLTLEGVLDKISVPFLITHGVNDRQIPVRHAQTTYDQAVNSPYRQLRLFGEEEGGAEHCGLDHFSGVITFTADWISDTFTSDEHGANPLKLDLTASAQP